MKKIQFLTIFLLISHFSNAQWDDFESKKEIKKIDVEEIIKKILTTDKDTLSFISIEITDSLTSKRGEEGSYIFDKEYLETHFSNLIEYDKDSLIVIRPYLEFTNIIISSPINFTRIVGLNIVRGIEILGEINPEITIYNVKAMKIDLGIHKSDNKESKDIIVGDYFNQQNTKIKSLTISSDNIYREFFMNNFVGAKFECYLNETESVWIMDNIIRVPDTLSSIIYTESLPGSIPTGFRANPHSYGFDLSINKVDMLNIEDNKFTHNSHNRISGQVKNTVITNNHFTGDLHLIEFNTTNEFIFKNNTLQNSLGLKSVILPELPELVSFRFDHFKGKKLLNLHPLGAEFYESGIYSDIGLIYQPERKEDFENDDAFEQLISDYNRFYRIYKDRGDLESSNEIYIEMKDLYTQKYKYEYLDSREMKDWFRWRLNQLLKVYTEHGTDPAKALVMSFYIVLLFAFIYLFFPSEWDIHSKSKIFENIKDALEKDKKGTFKSISLSFYHLLIMVLNAFTLSLNSFTTLGFGNIPTKGLARYLTIIQGFVGWFLLGLFSVSLINQVLG